MMVPVRVAYTLEQCWHRVPGGTGVAALRTAEAMDGIDDVELIGVAGRHTKPPHEEWMPTIPWKQLPIAAPWLYESWLHLNWPRPESVTGPVDIVHATTLIPCPTRKPLVVTLHDLAFLHTPANFTRHGNRVFNRSLELTKRWADLVLCCSLATMDDCVVAGIDSDRLRHVPLGVEFEHAEAADVVRVRVAYQLPERYLLFVGTVEPRKNLRRLAKAVSLLEEPLPLIVAGADGWGDAGQGFDSNVRFLGFVPKTDLWALYAGAHVFCYPSVHEGFGLPVLEAMAQGTPVVTSGDTATQEAADGAAILVDPNDIADIARGITEAAMRRAELSTKGRHRVAQATWHNTAELTAAAYGELV
ncbi:MAG: glycosyltransferase [Ilumatobacteraceae bacterium]|nr:glycosyltransferase [Ilumatobacteraceae bacterium]